MYYDFSNVWTFCRKSSSFFALLVAFLYIVLYSICLVKYNLIRMTQTVLPCIGKQIWSIDSSGTFLPCDKYVGKHETCCVSNNSLCWHSFARMLLFWSFILHFSFQGGLSNIMFITDIMFITVYIKDTHHLLLFDFTSPHESHIGLFKYHFDHGDTNYLPLEKVCRGLIRPRFLLPAQRAFYPKKDSDYVGIHEFNGSNDSLCYHSFAIMLLLL